MKNTILTAIMMSSLLMIGCGKMKGSSNATTVVPPPFAQVPPGGQPFVPVGTGPGLGPGNNWQYGGTAPLQIDNLVTFTDYTEHTMTNPQNVAINLNLTKYGNGFGGVVSIEYTDNGEAYHGYFTSGDSDEANQYNIWFNSNGQKVWHGFFEDYIGGLVVVIDDVVDLGDGGGPTDTVGGSVWYKNFGQTWAPHPPTLCWFISLGPYDCRAWPTDEGVETTRAVEPDNGYKKLGTFTGLSLKDAFNGEASL